MLEFTPIFLRYMQRNQGIKFSDNVLLLFLNFNKVASIHMLHQTDRCIMAWLHIGQHILDGYYYETSQENVPTNRIIWQNRTLSLEMQKKLATRIFYAQKEGLVSNSSVLLEFHGSISNWHTVGLGFFLVNMFLIFSIPREIFAQPIKRVRNPKINEKKRHSLYCPFHSAL